MTLRVLPAAITSPGRTVYVDSRISGEVTAVCNTYGVKAYSGKRVEPGSDHNCGAAVDFVGTNDQQKRLYNYGLTKTDWWVEPWASSHTIGALGTTGPHVHISFFRCGSVPGSNKPIPSGKLSFTQIRDIWLQAGGSKYLADTMAAIALAESKGDPKAHCKNCVPGVIEDSRGLWQINVDPSANPEYANWNLYNPITNAQAAKELAHGGKGLDNWTTFKDGSWKDNLPKGGSGGIGSLPEKIIGGISGVPGDIWHHIPGTDIPGQVAHDIASPIESGFTYLGKTIFYGLIIMIGAITALIGLVMIGVDIGFANRSSRFGNTLNYIPKARGYSPRKQNAKAYKIGVQRGERAKASKEGYEHGKSGTMVSVKSRAKKPKVLNVKKTMDEAAKKEQKKKLDSYGKVPY